MQEVFNWLYTLMTNIITWLFSMMIVEGVSIGALIVTVSISALVISNLMLIAKK